MQKHPRDKNHKSYPGGASAKNASRNNTGHALKDSERRWTHVINSLPEATLAINLEHKVIAWNQAMEEMTGVKGGEMMGKGNYEYVVPFIGYRRPILIDYVLKPDPEGESQLSVIRERNNLLIMDLFIPRLKGKNTFLWCKACPLYDRKGHVVGAIESIRDITELKRREKDLRDLNTALHVLLKQREKDRSELEDQILSSIKLLIEPFVEKLKHHTDTAGRPYIEMIETNLANIVAPFAHKLSANYMNLTNKEILVASLIKEGKTTKEITDIIHISESAVNVYRHHIRKKLGLTKKQNLHAYLASLLQN